MTEDKLNELYEKLYFLEIESREKIYSRLQLPLTLIVAIVGALVFLLQNADFETATATPSRVMFIVFIAAATLTLVAAIYLFINALYNHTYLFLPDSSATANYKELLEQTYAQFQNSQQLVENALRKYIINYYIEYAAFNTRVNDRRSMFLHFCNGAIVGTTILLFAAYLSFYFGGLDKNNNAKPPTDVRVIKPVEIRIQDQRR